MTEKNQVKQHHGYIIGMRNDDTFEFMTDGWCPDCNDELSKPFITWYRVIPAQKEYATQAYNEKLHVLITLESGAIRNIQKIVDFED